MEQTKRKLFGLPIISFVALMSIFFLEVGTGAVTPAIQSFIEAFPNESLSKIFMIQTMPTLVMVVADLFIGKIAGTRIRYRTLLIIGAVTYLVGGVFPFFLADATTVNLILVCRGFVGFGNAIIFTIGNALPYVQYGAHSEKVMGFGLTSMNLGGMVFQLLGGFLCLISWNFTFLAYLITIIPLALIIFTFKEPEHANDEAQTADGKKEKSALPFMAYLLALVHFLSNVLVYPIFLNLSTIIVLEEIGNSATAGTAFSLLTLGAMAGGLMFAKTFKIFGRFSISFALLIEAGGLILVYLTHSLIGVFIATVLLGISMSLMNGSSTTFITSIAPAKSVPFAASMIVFALNLSAVVGTYYCTPLTLASGPKFVFLVSAIASVAIAALSTLLNPKKYFNNGL